MIESSELEVLFKVRVCFNFDATSEDELSIREGDIIHVTQVFEGWSTGVLQNGMFGYFPTDYAERIEDDTLVDSESSSSEEPLHTVQSNEHAREEKSQVLTPPQPRSVPKYSQDKAAEMIVNYWRLSKYRKRVEKFLKNIRVRINLVKELITSEQNYVEYLMVMRDMYINPLREKVKNKKKILTDAEISILFGNLEQLLNLAVQILDNLTTASSDSSKDLSEVFMRILPFLKLYTVYVQNYDKAVILMTEKLKKDKEFAIFLKNARNSPRSKGLDLRDLISKPFQRIFAYKNIFNRMISLTPKESASYMKLITLDKQMEDLVLFINESKRMYENQQKLNQRISSEWGLDNMTQSILLKRWRKYVREGRLKLTYPIGSQKEVWIDCFMANDVFFFIKDNELRTMYICLTDIVELPEDSLAVELNSYPKETNSCRVQFSDEQEMKDWVSDFQRCIEKERAFAEEHGIQGGTKELLQKWITTLQVAETRRRDLDVLKDKLGQNKEQSRGVTQLIDAMRKDVQEYLHKLALHISERQQIAEARALLVRDQVDSLKKMEQTLQVGKESKELFETIFRNEADVFPSVFGNTFSMFSDHLSYFKTFDSEVSLNKESAPAPRVINSDLKEHFEKLKVDYELELGSLLESVKDIDYNEQNYELLYRLINLEQKLKCQETKVRYTEKENDLLNSKLNRSFAVISDLQHKYSQVLSSKTKDGSGIIFDEISKAIPSLMKEAEFNIIQEQIKTSEHVSHIEESREHLQKQLNQKEETNKQLAERCIDLERQICTLQKELERREKEEKEESMQQFVASSTSPKAGPPLSSKPFQDVARLEKIVMMKDKQNINLQQEIKNMQETLSERRKEKEIEIQGVIRKMQLLDSVHNYQRESLSLSNEKLKAMNRDLRQEVETYKTLLSENEGKMIELFNQCIQECSGLHEHSAVMDKLQNELEISKLNNLSLEYKLIKAEGILVENEELKEKLKRQKNMLSEIQEKNQAFEKKLTSAEEEVKRLNVLLSERTVLNKHASMINLPHKTRIGESSPQSPMTPQSPTSPQTVRDSRPLPVPVRKMSGNLLLPEKESNQPKQNMKEETRTPSYLPPPAERLQSADTEVNRTRRAATVLLGSSRRSVPISYETTEKEKAPLDKRASHFIAPSAQKVALESILAEMKRKNMNL